MVQYRAISPDHPEGKGYYPCSEVRENAIIRHVMFLKFVTKRINFSYLKIHFCKTSFSMITPLTGGDVYVALGILVLQRQTLYS